MTNVINIPHLEKRVAALEALVMKLTQDLEQARSDADSECKDLRADVDRALEFEDQIDSLKNFETDIEQRVIELEAEA